MFNVTFILVSIRRERQHCSMSLTYSTPPHEVHILLYLFIYLLYLYVPFPPHEDDREVLFSLLSISLVPTMMKMMKRHIVRQFAKR